MSDKYDDAIEYLTEHPSEIGKAWCSGGEYKARTLCHCLFQYIPGDSSNVDMGCLTQVKNSPFDEKTYASGFSGGIWQDRIMVDPNIPKQVEEITVDMLPTFAEYQREMDNYR